MSEDGRDEDLTAEEAHARAVANVRANMARGAAIDDSIAESWAELVAAHGAARRRWLAIQSREAQPG